MSKFVYSQTGFFSGQIGKDYKGKWNSAVYSSGLLEMTNMTATKSGSCERVAGEKIKKIRDLSFFSSFYGTSQYITSKTYSTVLNEEEYTVIVVFMYVESSGDIRSFLIYYNPSSDTSFIPPLSAPYEETRRVVAYNTIGLTQEQRLEKCTVDFSTVRNQIFVCFNTDTDPIVLTETTRLQSNIYLLDAQNFSDYLLYPTFNPPNIDPNKKIGITKVAGSNPLVPVELDFTDSGLEYIPEIVAIGGIWDDGAGNLQTGLNYFKPQSVGKRSLVGDVVLSFPVFTYNATDYDENGNPQVTNNLTWPADGSYSEFYTPSIGNFVWPTNSDDKVASWPSICSSSDNRLIFSGVENNRDYFYGSEVGNPSNFGNVKPFLLAPNTNVVVESRFIGDIVTTDPYAFAVASKDGAEIKWVRSSNELFLGTTSGIFIASAETIISVTDINVRQISNKASSGESVPGVNGVYYTADDDEAFIKINYFPANQSYGESDLSVLSPSLFRDISVKDICYIKNNNATYLLLENGKRYFCFDFTETNSKGFSVVDTKVNVESCSYLTKSAQVIGTFKASNTSVGIYTQKPLSGGENIDYTHFSQAKALTGGVLDIGFDIEDGTKFYYESGIITGEVESINNQLIIDGVDGDLYSFGVIESCKIKTMPLEAGQQWGSPEMSVKSIDGVQVRVIDSYSYKLKLDGDNYQEEQTHPDYELADSFIRTSTDGNWETDKILEIRNDKPEPLTISSITFRGVANDG